MKKHIRFIINPISGVGNKKTLPQLIRSNLNQQKFTFDIVYTEYSNHAKAITRKAVQEKVEIVCAVGGDGTVNEIGGELANSSTAMAIIPSGSGNGLARHLHIPLNTKKAIKQLNKAKEILIDIGKIENHTFIGTAGFGFDAIIAHEFDKVKKRGFLSYVRLILKEFKYFKPILIFWKDKKLKKSNLFFCTVANGSQFGNGAVIAPDASLTDRQLRLIFIKKPSFLNFFVLVVQSYTKRINTSKFTETYKIKNATIILSTNKGHIDGEPITFDSKEVNIEVLPACLSLFV